MPDNLTTEETLASLPWTQRPATPELNKALAAFQAELPNVTKTKTANVVSQRTGVKFSYSYADLAVISAVVMPLLGKHGLAFTAMPLFNDAGEFVLRYSLLHASGEERTGEYRLRTGTAQEMGSEITYARRYCLCSATGVAAEEDDDGQAATQAQQPSRSQARHPEPAPEEEKGPGAQELADAALELVADAENGKMPPGDALTLLKTAVYDVAARGKVLRSPVIATDGEGTYLTNVIGQARKELEGLYQAESQ